MLVAGAAGLGKSSFIDAFLHRKFLEGPVIRQPTTEITYHSGKRTEGDFNFEVCMVDTPGYRVGAEKGYYAMLRKEITDKVMGVWYCSLRGIGRCPRRGRLLWRIRSSRMIGCIAVCISLMGQGFPSRMAI